MFYLGIMKALFWLAVVGLLLFEIANVYFIMPIPGSQKMNSIDFAYFLYHSRWKIRIFLALIIMIGLANAKWKRNWVPVIPIALLFVVFYLANFKMAADHMFYQPKKLLLVGAAENKVDTGRLVLGVEMNGQAKAYPIRFLGFHHQVQDTIGGKPVMVTYCTVCRTGRVYEPIVSGKYEKFRLVGMDHFNAMFEDVTTKSWWRQVTGEAIAGKLKGQQLPEVFSTQTSLAQWLSLHPNTLIMQADSTYIKSFDTTGNFESGKSKDELTGTDSLSWKDKSWVIGVKAGKERKAYDWNELKKERLIADKIGEIPVLLVLTEDNKSFFVFERPDYVNAFFLHRDTLLFKNHFFRIDGTGIDTSFSLKPLQASQEFWHSWRAFYPNSRK
jgi:hypothetical protein